MRNGGNRLEIFIAAVSFVALISSCGDERSSESEATSDSQEGERSSGDEGTSDSQETEALPEKAERAHGAVHQPGTDLWWAMCPVGKKWNGSECEGHMVAMKRGAALEACPEGFRLPTDEEVKALFGKCESDATPPSYYGNCQSCLKNPACKLMFGDDVVRGRPEKMSIGTLLNGYPNFWTSSQYSHVPAIRLAGQPPRKVSRRVTFALNGAIHTIRKGREGAWVRCLRQGRPTKASTLNKSSKNNPPEPQDDLEKAVAFQEKMYNVIYENREDCKQAARALEEFIDENEKEMHWSHSKTKVGAFKTDKALDEFHERFKSRHNKMGERFMPVVKQCRKNKAFMKVLKRIPGL
jgi:hypothetical protein